MDWRKNLEISKHKAARENRVCLNAFCNKNMSGFIIYFLVHCEHTWSNGSPQWIDNWKAKGFYQTQYSHKRFIYPSRQRIFLLWEFSIILNIVFVAFSCSSFSSKSSFFTIWFTLILLNASEWKQFCFFIVLDPYSCLFWLIVIRQKQIYVTWSLRNHSHMLIWCLKNISYYYWCWTVKNQLLP